MDDAGTGPAIRGDADAAACVPTLAGLPVVPAAVDPVALTEAVERALTWGLPLVIDLGSPGEASPQANPAETGPTMAAEPVPAIAQALAWAEALRALARAGGVVPVVGVGRPQGPGARAVAALADVVTASGEEAGQVLGFLPPNALTDPPSLPPNATDAPDVAGAALDDLVPAVPELPFDVGVVLDAVLDPSALPVGDRDRPLRTLLARVDGAPLGVVAVDPAHRRGMPAAADARAAARFVSWCDAFGLPVLTLLDVPDALDPLAETDACAAAALASAYGSATSGLVTVVLRRAHGLTAALLGLPGRGADVTLAWPGADVDALGAGVVVLQRPALTRREVAAALGLARRRRDTPPPRRHPLPPR